MKKYITITDPKGATQGYGGPFVPVSHSVLYENKAFYGFESVQKLFPSHQAMIDFFVAAIARPFGALGTHLGFEWSLSAEPTTHYSTGSVEVLTKSE